MSERRVYAVAARALLRDTVLDAVADLLSDRDWSAITMADVARAAGVSRQTIYNEFGDRRGVAEAYLLREGERLVVLAERSIAAHPHDVRRAIEAAFATFLAAVEGHPVVRAIAAGGDGDELLALLTARGTPVPALAADRLAEFLVRGWPALAPPDARLVADTVVRLAISHAALPGTSPARTAAGLARLLAPFLDQRLAAAA